MLSHLRGGRLSALYNRMFVAPFARLEWRQLTDDLSSGAGRELVRLDGFDLYVDPQEAIGRRIKRSGKHEPHLEAFLRQRLRTGDVFLDVGANIGFMTMLAASAVGPGGKVIAVEPNPDNVSLIEASIAANGFSQIRIIPAAASDTSTELPFGIIGSNGSILPKKLPGGSTVRAIRLDDELADEPRIDIIKIDIEGHEPFALRGLEKTIAKHRPVITSELHPYLLKQHSKTDPLEYLRQIEGLGYSLSVIDDDVVGPIDSAAVMRLWQAKRSKLAHLDILATNQGAI
jgi:FkbM family methyltransferase